MIILSHYISQPRESLSTKTSGSNGRVSIATSVFPVASMQWLKYIVRVSLAGLMCRRRRCRGSLTLQAVPGIGPLTATALVATATDLSSFESGRQFAACLGLTTRQTGTGGKTRQLGLSKRGDAYVRTMLMHGARAVITRSSRSSWIERLLQRRPYSVVVAALANKLARTAWAVLAKGKAFDQAKWNPTEIAAA